MSRKTIITKRLNVKKTQKFLQQNYANETFFLDSKGKPNNHASYNKKIRAGNGSVIRLTNGQFITDKLASKIANS